MSLRTKLIILILVFVIPSVGLMVIFNSQMVEQFRTQSIQYQKSSLNMLGGVFRFLEFDTRTSLQTISIDHHLTSGALDCAAYLDQVVEKGDFDHLFVIEPGGKISCASNGFDLIKSQVENSAYKRLEESKEFLFDEMPPVSDGMKPRLFASIPIKNENTETIGIIAGVLSDEKISKVMTRAELPEKTEVYFFDIQGKLLYPGETDNPGIADQLGKKVTELAANQPLSRQRTSIFYQNKQYEYWVIPQSYKTNFILIVGFNNQQFIDETAQFTSGNIAILALLTIVFLLLANKAVDATFSKPMATLTQTAEMLAEGRFDVRANLGRKDDEIGKLSKILDKMASALENSQVSLEKETSAKMASEEKFYRLFEDSILGIFQITPGGNLVEANPALARMFGYASTEALLEANSSSNDSLFINIHDSETIFSNIQGHQPVHLETQFKKHDGTAFIGDLHIWGVWNTAGELDSMEGFVEDISDKIKTRDQLVKLSQAVEQNPIGILITDGKGNIEYANIGCMEIFGYSPDEIIGKPLGILVPDSTPENELDIIRKTLENGGTYRGEIRNYKKNGEAFWERFVVTHIQNDHKDIGNTLVLLEDISEQYTNRFRINQQVEEISALRTIDLAISSNLDIQATLNIIGNLAIKHLCIDAVSIEIFDARYNMLHTAVYSGFSREASGEVPFPSAADLTDWELIEEFSVHVPDNLKERRSGFRIAFPDEEQFSACFGLPLVAKAEVKGLFRVYLKEPLTPEQHWLDFFYNLAAQTAIAIDNFELLNNLKKSNTDLMEAYDATIEGWSKALNYRDAETEDHCVRTTTWTVELAKELGYAEDDLIHIRRGALLHDIGKVAVPDAILNKPGPLTDEEWVEMRRHPVAAYEVLSPIKFLEKSVHIPYCHHERWDGKGYPRGLTREEIPLSARIFSVIDVYDALTTDRPYRKAWPDEKVINYLRENSGSQFDPMVVDAFLNLLEKQKSA